MMERSSSMQPKKHVRKPILTCFAAQFHLCQVGNAIGKGNRHFFIVFLWLELYSMAVSAVVGCIQINSHLASLGSTANLVRAVVTCVVLLSPAVQVIIFGQ
jgi:hypothetical protein